MSSAGSCFILRMVAAIPLWPAWRMRLMARTPVHFPARTHLLVMSSPEKVAVELLATPGEGSREAVRMMVAATAPHGGDRPATKR